MGHSPEIISLILSYLITFNPWKSVCLVFRPAKYKLFCPRVHIGNAQLEYVYVAKYLGFMIYEDKKDDCNMLRQLRTLYAQSNKIIRTFNHYTIDVKLLLIKSYCTPIIVDIQIIRKLRTANYELLLIMCIDEY